jgi:hypothetical protein
MQIELAPHVGKKKTKRGPVEVELDQFQVMAVSAANGVTVRKRIGYVGKKDGAPLLLIAKLSDGEKARVTAEVARLKGHAVGRVTQTPSLVDPPQGDDE